MKLTRYTDYALRVMMHLAAHPDRLVSIGEISRAHRVSENHLTKVAQHLSGRGLVASVRGRNGGLRLARPAEWITVGEVVRAGEGDCRLIDCEGCALTRRCGLAGVLAEARRAFFSVLDGRTIAEVAAAPDLLAGAA